MFYDKLAQVCKLRNTSLSKVLKELNMSSSSVTTWRTGITPTLATIQKLADYLQVPAHSLLDDDPRYRPLNDSELELLRIFDTLDETAQQRFLAQAQLISLFSQGDPTQSLMLLKQVRESGLSPVDTQEILNQKLIQSSF